MNTITVTLTERQAELVRDLLFTISNIAEIVDCDEVDPIIDLLDIDGDNEYNLR